jgi:SAM-dependent methyltransferase
MGENATEHWDSVYGTKATDEVSWYQRHLTTSLRLLTSVSSPRGAVIDVGAGASTLADSLLDSGWSDVTALDVSSTALAVVRDRLHDHHRDHHDDHLGAHDDHGGDRPARPEEAVSFVVADILSWQPGRTYDAWHDRAVFHFLVRPDQREHYVATASRAVRPGGVLILGTFAADGPTRCSGLPTSRYDANALATAFAPDFRLEHSEREEHVTPGGAVQPFTWAVLRRR